MPQTTTSAAKKPSDQPHRCRLASLTSSSELLIVLYVVAQRMVLPVSACSQWLSPAVN